MVGEVKYGGKGVEARGGTTALHSDVLRAKNSVKDIILSIKDIIPDPFGKRSVRLMSQLSYIDRLLGNSSSVKWVKERIEDTYKSKDNVKELKWVFGEFSPETRNNIKYALDRNFDVTVVSGPKLYCEAYEAIKEFFKCEKFKIYISNERPINHFAIIAQQHLFIEVPHPPELKKHKGLGIEQAKGPFISDLSERFKELYQTSHRIESIEDLEKYAPKSICLKNDPV